MFTLGEILAFVLVYYIIPGAVLLLIIRGGSGKLTPEQKKEEAEFNAKKEPDVCYWNGRRVSSKEFDRLWDEEQALKKKNREY